jgi:choline-sulfatase
MFKSKPFRSAICGMLAMLGLGLHCQAEPHPSIILISVDTLRADHLGCYNAKASATPNIDSFAKHATLFSQVSSLVPLTLPSHAAMFTSTYPFVTGVEDNGVPLKSSAVTLASVLRAQGYRTAAFIGGFVLDRRFGLNTGFDYYDSPFDLHNKTVSDAGAVKRPGSEVIGAATRWLQDNEGAPFFLFLHLYDLHTPYDLKDRPGERYGERGYNAELSSVDKLLGSFFKYLNGQSLFEPSLIAFTSDHGESLGEHGESTHGFFIYQSTIEVPLIIHWPRGFNRPTASRINKPVSLIDLAPTLLDAVGVPRAPQMQGRSLLGASGTEQLYSESLYARNHFDCAALRSIRVGKYKYIEAPRPELYDLDRDPREAHNLYYQQRPTAVALQQRMAALSRTNRKVSSSHSQAPETYAALRSLGYLAASAASEHPASTIDPKDRIGALEQFSHALALASTGHIDESTSLLQTLSKQLPNNSEVHVSLGLNYQREGNFSAAARSFTAALKAAPMNAQAHFDLAISYFRLRQPGDALNEIRAALAIEPWYTQAEELAATIYLENKDFAKARSSFAHILSIDPQNYTAHYDLGVLAALDRNWPESMAQLHSALATDPSSAEAYNMLGSVYLQRNEPDLAVQALEKAIEVQPKLAVAHYNLALALRKQGKQAEAEDEFQKSLALDPQRSAAREALKGPGANSGR